MEQIQKQPSVDRERLRSLSALFGRGAEIEQTRSFAETAAQVGQHREILFEYINRHTAPTLLYRSQEQVDSADKEVTPTVTPMKQAKRRNRDLSLPELDLYEYFTDRGGMKGDTVMEDREGRLEGMAFLATEIAQKSSRYERTSDEMKTQRLLQTADSAEHLVREKKACPETLTRKEQERVLKDSKKLADDGTQPNRSELAQLVQEAVHIGKAPSDTALADHESLPLAKDAANQTDEPIHQLARQYLAREKQQENFLTLDCMVYRRDHEKVDRMVKEDYALETGKAASLLVLRRSRTADPTLAEILRIQAAQARDASVPEPPEDQEADENHREDEDEPQKI